MTEPADVVFLNGRFLPASSACVSVYDRGLMFGDGLFETLRSYRGWPFGLAEHMERLRASAGVLGIPVPDYHWPTVLTRLLRRNRFETRDAAVRLTLTRGVSGPSLQPPPDPRPTCIATVRPVDPSVPSAQRRGVAVTVLPFARDGLMAEHKTLDYLPAILGRTMAGQCGCSDGLYVDGKNLREGTTASLFLVRQKSLFTPCLDGILPGVTRRMVLELAAGERIRTAERCLTVKDLLRSDEAFLCSSIAEIVPVVSVDRHPIASGRPGSMTRSLQKLYRRTVREHRARSVAGLDA